MVVQAMPQQGILLDTGCGDGYYTKAVTEALQAAGKAVHVYGVDISKYAVDLAAKQEKAATFAVGSVFHLPVSDHCCDGIFLVCTICRNRISTSAEKAWHDDFRHSGSKAFDGIETGNL